MASDDAIRVGVVGLGSHGRRRLEILRAHPAARVVACCDIDPSCAPLAGDAPFHSRWEEVPTGELDAVLIALSPRDPARIAESALRAGLHVFCEKPPAPTCEALQAVRRAEEAASDRVLMYGFNHRLHGSVKRARELVASGSFGRVLSLRGVYGKAGPGEGTWRRDPEIAGGGILMDQGIHMVDLLRVFGGEYPHVVAHVEHGHWRLPVEDNVHALLHSDRGVTALLHSSATEWRHRFRLEIGLEEGEIVLDGLQSASGRYAPERLLTRSREGEEHVESFDEDTSLAEEIDLFLRAIHGEPVEHGASEEAERTLALVERLYRSPLKPSDAP